MRLWLLTMVSVCCIAATAPAPSPQEIVRRSVQAVETDWSQAGGYTYQERDVESKHGGTATIKTYEVLMIEGSPYNRLIRVNDELLSSGEQAEQTRLLQQAIAKRGHESKREHDKRVAKYEKERERDHAMLLDMEGAFDFRLTGSETVDGHDCWVLDASPKRGFQPYDHVTKVLSGMRGKLWVDKASYQWLKVQAQVFKPVSFYGFVARVGPGTKFFLEQEPVADNLWLPKHFSVQVKASALGFLDESSTDDETYANYRPMPKVLAELGAERQERQ